MVVAVRDRAARRYRCAFRRASSARSRRSGTAACCWGAIPVFTGRCLRASYFETDFASFLAWRDWGFPDRGCVQRLRHGRAALLDGAFVLGEMGQHTANAGRIYFPSGTPDLDDVSGGAVDIAGSIAREIEEETGFDACRLPRRSALGLRGLGCSDRDDRILDVDCHGEALRARIEANLARQPQPELSAIHLVRGTADLTAAMPRFVTAFMERQFAQSLVALS